MTQFVLRRTVCAVLVAVAGVAPLVAQSGETPLPSNAYFKAMGVVAHWDKTSNSVYGKSSDSPIGVGDALQAEMLSLPVDHYRTALGSDVAFYNRIKSIITSTNPYDSRIAAPRADIQVAYRKSCSSPSSDDPGNTSTALTISQNPIPSSATSVTATVKVCWNWAAGRPHDLNGNVRVVLNGNTYTATRVGFGVYTVNVPLPAHGQYPSLTFTASYVPSQQTNFYHGSTTTLMSMTSPAGPPLGCKADTGGKPGTPTDTEGNALPGIDLLSDTSTDLDPTTARDAIAAGLTGLVTGLGALPNGDPLSKYIGWIEGPNEYNNAQNRSDPYNATHDPKAGVWQQALATFSHALIDSVHDTSIVDGQGRPAFQNVSTLAPAMAFYGWYQHSVQVTDGQGYITQAISPLSFDVFCGTGGKTNCFDYGNTHAYPGLKNGNGPFGPESNLETGLESAHSVSGQTWQSGGENYDGSGSPSPVFQTESGYQNSTSSSQLPSTTMEAAGQFGPRTLAEYVATRTNGNAYFDGKTPPIVAMNFYELSDDNICPSSEQSNFGLEYLHQDSNGNLTVVRKPIWWSLHWALDALIDFGTPTIHPLNYSLTNNDPSLHHLLLQHSGTKDTYYLLLWRAAPLSDPTSSATITAGTGTSLSSVQFMHPSNATTGGDSTRPTWSTINGSGSWTLQVGGDLTIVRLIRQ